MLSSRIRVANMKLPLLNPLIVVVFSGLDSILLRTCSTAYTTLNFFVHSETFSVRSVPDAVLECIILSHTRPFQRLRRILQRPLVFAQSSPRTLLIL